MAPRGARGLTAGWPRRRGQDESLSAARLGEPAVVMRSVLTPKEPSSPPDYPALRVTRLRQQGRSSCHTPLGEWCLAVALPHGPCPREPRRCPHVREARGAARRERTAEGGGHRSRRAAQE